MMKIGDIVKSNRGREYKVLEMWFTYAKCVRVGELVEGESKPGTWDYEGPGSRVTFFKYAKRVGRQYRDDYWRQRYEFIDGAKPWGSTEATSAIEMAEQES